MTKGPSVLQKQINYMSHDDPAVRYWALQGILTQKEDVRPAMPQVRKMLRDVSVNRVDASQALCSLGETEPGLEVLIEWLHHPQPLVALPAANALDHLGETARPVLPQVRPFMVEEPNTDLLGWQFPR